jgi:hypothetical protein
MFDPEELSSKQNHSIAGMLCLSGKQAFAVCAHTDNVTKAITQTHAENVLLQCTGLAHQRYTSLLLDLLPVCQVCPEVIDVGVSIHVFSSETSVPAAFFGVRFE